MTNENRSIQVLNISNVNAQGKTVLNDGKLLELIQKYPFLYNPRVRPYNDSDYTDWAWKHINAEFNRSYENDPSAAFSTGDLMTRWEVLKPLIQCLSKAYDLDAIPQSLRQSVVKISTELEDQRTNISKKPNTPTQNFLLQQMPAIAALPMEQKLALEREMLDLILTAELESKQSVKLNDAIKQEINQEVDEFLSDIGFKQVLLTSFNHKNIMYNSNNNGNHHQSLNIKTYSSHQYNGRNWVPLKDAKKYIKPCQVNIQRMNFEDYLPLSKIKQFSKLKH